MRSRRQATPRGPAFQRYDWQIDIYLSYETVSDTTNDATVDQEFPLILDAVMKALRTTAIPVVITDPTTGATSQIQSIGEDMTLDYPPEESPGSMQLVYYTARLTTLVMEVIQA